MSDQPRPRDETADRQDIRPKGYGWLTERVARVVLLAALLAGVAVVVGLFWSSWFGDDGPPVVVAGGDPDLGQDALRAYGCIACHSVPGVRGPQAYVGPPLDAWSQRRYIAGAIENNPDNLIYWIQFPDAVEPGTAMPTLGVSDEDARHIAAYLFSLE